MLFDKSGILHCGLCTSSRVRFVAILLVATLQTFRIRHSSSAMTLDAGHSQEHCSPRVADTDRLKVLREMEQGGNASLHVSLPIRHMLSE